MSDVIDQLRERRRAAGVSQSEMARRLGTTQSAVSRLEASSSARLDTLDRYAAALGWNISASPPSPLDDAVAGIRASLARDDAEAAFRAVVQLHDDVERLTDPSPALRREPDRTDDRRWDALVAGIVERLAHRSNADVPGWTAAPSRRLEVLWFPVADVLGRPISPGLAGHLLAASPPELSVRGIFVDPSSLVSR